MYRHCFIIQNFKTKMDCFYFAKSLNITVESRSTNLLYTNVPCTQIYILDPVREHTPIMLIST